MKHVFDSWANSGEVGIRWCIIMCLLNTLYYLQQQLCVQMLVSSSLRPVQHTSYLFHPGISFQLVWLQVTCWKLFYKPIAAISPDGPHLNHERCCPSSHVILCVIEGFQMTVSLLTARRTLKDRRVWLFIQKMEAFKDILFVHLKCFENVHTQRNPSFYSRFNLIAVDGVGHWGRNPWM